MAPLRPLSILLVCCLALSGCISTGSDFGNNNGQRGAEAARVESLESASWSSGQRHIVFDVPAGFDYVMTTYSQGGQTYGAPAYTTADGHELDGGPAASHAGGFQLVRAAPAAYGSTSFTAPHAMGGGQFTATAYDNVDPTLLMSLTWGGSRADSVGLDTTFGFYAPEGPSELTVVVQAGGGQAGTIKLESPDGSTRELAGPAAGGAQGVSTMPNVPGVWKLHVGGLHNGGHQVVVSAVPEIDDLDDWF